MNKMKTEQEITHNWIGEIEKPLVSICCITYNHEKYVRYAIEGLLIQETDFPFEILIHDDASSDRTAEIISEYHELYPNIIKPIYQEENQYSKGIAPNIEFNYPRAKGEYIAYCEGDDYWTDSNKLAKQIKFLEDNPQFIATSHKVRVIDQNNDIKNVKLNLYSYASNIYSISDFEQYKLPGQLATIVYRNIWGNLDDRIKEKHHTLKVNGDRKLALLLVLEGKVYCFPEVMSNYRLVSESGNSWTARNVNKNLSLKKYLDLIRLERFAKQAYNTNLNFKRQRLDCFYSALLYYIKQPRRENLDILKKMLRLNYDKTYEFLFHSMFRAFIWPIEKLIASRNHG